MAVSQSGSHPPAVQWHTQINSVISVQILLVIIPTQLAHRYSSKGKDYSRWISCYLFFWSMFRCGKGKKGLASIHSLSLSIFYTIQYCLRGKEHKIKKKYKKVIVELQSITTKYFQMAFYLHYMKELALNILNWKALGTNIANAMPLVKCDLNTNWISSQPIQVWWSWLLLQELFSVCLWSRTAQRWQLLLGLAVVLN